MDVLAHLKENGYSFEIGEWLKIEPEVDKFLKVNRIEYEVVISDRAYIKSLTFETGKFTRKLTF